MTIYSRIGFRVLDEYPASVEALLKMLSTTAKRYLIDEGMRLYRVPWNSVAYEYIKKIKALLREGEYFELIEKEFSKAEYDIAVAYRLQFGSFIYTYNDDISPEYYYDLCCEGGSVYIKQNKNFMVPKSSFNKKDYGILSSWRFAVSEMIMNEIISMGASVDDFMPVLTKKGEIVCYQIEPVNIIFGMSEINNWRKESGCSKCNYSIYWELDGKASLISEELLSGLRLLNKTGELLGDANIAEYIINKELYEFLHAKYPKMCFEPIFLISNAPKEN